jgi:hypothetical protein
LEHRDKHHLGVGSDHPRGIVHRLGNVLDFARGTARVATPARENPAGLRVFGNSPDFWLNVQRRTDLWEALNSPRERQRVERARPLGTAA